MKSEHRYLTCVVVAGLFALPPVDSHASETSAPTSPKTTPEVRAMLDSLAPDDLKANSSRLDTVMNGLFAGTDEDLPCNDPGPWVSSVSLCEWHAPGTRRDGLPEAFVSVSSGGIDSVVLWGSTPLNATTWQCEIAEGWRQATVCVPGIFSEDRKKTLFREWRVTLAEITRPGDESSAKPQPPDD